MVSLRGFIYSMQNVVIYVKNIYRPIGQQAQVNIHICFIEIK